MERKLLGTVTQEEKSELFSIYRRKNALKELIAAADVCNNPNLYEKIISDLCDTNEGINKWWISVSKKYEWITTENNAWTLDFETNNLYITELNNSV